MHDVASVSISAVGNCTLTGKIDFGSQQRSVTLEEYKVAVGKLTVAVSLTVKLVTWVEWETKLVDHKFWDGITIPENKAPAEPRILYTFPDPI